MVNSQFFMLNGTDEKTLFVVGIPAPSVIPAEAGIQSVGTREQRRYMRVLVTSRANIFHNRQLKNGPA